MRAIEVRESSVEVSSIYGSANTNTIETLPADTVVFVSNNWPNRALYEALEEQGQEVEVEGNASCPRFLTYATREDHRAGTCPSDIWRRLRLDLVEDWTCLVGRC